MKVIGKRSIASLLKLVIDFVWNAAIVLYSANFASFILTFIISGSSCEIHGRPINLESDVTSSAVSPAAVKYMRKESRE